MLVHNRDDIEFVTEFPCFLRHPVLQEAGRAIIRKGFPLLLSLVGDTLSNFTWENGLGMARLVYYTLKSRL